MRSIVVVAAACAFVACFVDRKSTGFECENQSDCDANRICTSGYCIVNPEPSCPLECTVAGGHCPIEGTCRFTCTSASSCAAPILCPPNMKCDVQCTSSGACGGGINCGAATDCTIRCSSQNTCNGPIQCGASACDVTCSGTNACTTVDCGGSCACDVNCSGNNACKTSVSCTDPSCVDNDGCDSGNSNCDTCP